MDFIISCFAIANIIFLKHNGNFNIFTNYFKEDSFFPEKLKLQNKAYWSFISFSKEMPRNLFKTLTFFRQENDQSAIDHKKFAFLEELNLLISKNKREKMYFTALINQFNYRFVATNIVLDYEIQEDKKEEIREILKNFDKKFTLSEYPNRSEKQLKVLLDFLEFKSIYNLYYHSKIDNSKVIHNAENIKKGSFGNYYKENRSEDNCIQILRFISANEINIDVYTEFKDLMQSYINSKISVQFINEKFSFKEHDLFILIKYFKFNDLLETIYERILPSIKETNQAEDSILFSDNIKEYLQETLDNILSLFAEYSHSFYTNVISDSFVNLLLVLSLINWEEDELKAIINKILRSFDKNNYPYNLIKAIDKFVLINYSLYSSKTNHFFKFIDLMLTKFVNGELSRVIGDNINNEFSHIYQFSHATTLKYDNLDLVKQAIAYIKYISNYNDERKRYFARLFLIQLFAIANEPTQQEIHSFLGNLRVKDWSDKYNSNYVEIFSELDFLQYGAELNKNFITFMDNWIQDYLTQDLVSNLHLLREGGVDLLMEYFNFLSDKKNLTEFEGLAKDLKDKLKGWGYADWQ